jgi:hypothetical protein
MQGPFFELKPDYLYIHPFQPLVFGNYEPPKDFPNCCHNHKKIMAEARELVNRFPNCCDFHKNMAKSPLININNYKTEEFAKSILTRLAYTEHHIEKNIELSNWYKDITDYIEYIIASFGTPSFGDHVYKWGLTSMIELRQDEIGTNKAQQIIDYVNGLYQQLPGEPIAEEIDLNELYHIYQKWLSVFPFTVQPFDKLKDRFTNIFPVIDDEPVYNPYTQLTKFRVITKGKLIAWLINKTQEILKSVDSQNLLKEGFINDRKAHRFDLVSGKHKTKQMKLLNEFSENEKQYLKIIKKWLSNEIDYFKEATTYLEKNQILALQTSQNLDKRQNVYNSMHLDEVRKWFIQLSENNSKSGKPFLTIGQVEQFIERAFVGNMDIPAPTLNATDREKGKIVGLFHLFYDHCNTHQPKVGKIDPLATAEKYIKLLTSNLDRWTFDEVKNNFRRGGNWKKPA